MAPCYILHEEHREESYTNLKVKEILVEGSETRILGNDRYNAMGIPVTLFLRPLI